MQRGFRVPLKAIVLVVVCVLEALLLFDLFSGHRLTGSSTVWIILHMLLCMVGAVFLYQLLLANASCRTDTKEFCQQPTSAGETPESDESDKGGAVILFIGLTAIALPGVGLPGISFTLLYGLHIARKRSYVPDFWQVTPVATLPYIAPLERQLSPVDSRGFTEHLLYSTDDNDVYHKVLASANVRTSLAINTLRQAMQHRDEKVRLTAYKTLDRKVTTLNKEIQRLEQSVEAHDDNHSSDQWLAIASNYWELVTLEGSETVARNELLSKAASAAIKAVALLPGNRNAHLVLGRISLAQGNTRRATVALERARALGMPADKVLPYLAECAFLEKDMIRVKRSLAGLDASIVAYPPLSHVARYWA